MPKYRISISANVPAFTSVEVEARNWMDAHESAKAFMKTQPIGETHWTLDSMGYPTDVRSHESELVE